MLISFTHSLRKYLMSTSSVLETVLHTLDTTEHQTEIPALMQLGLGWGWGRMGQLIHNQIIACDNFT
jgi:hypothetical protein